MNKAILALALCVCQPMFAVCNYSLLDMDYAAFSVDYKGHDYIIFESRMHPQFEIMHDPDCERCYLDANPKFDFSDGLGCVQTTKGSDSYVVDKSGCVKQI